MSERKSQILETSADTLRTESFHAFGVRKLAECLGVTKVSIHHHFPTKDALGIALLDFYEANGERLRQLEEHFLELMTSLLANARAAGSISFLGSARDQAILVTSALLGARQMKGANASGRPSSRSSDLSASRRSALTRTADVRANFGQAHAEHS